MRALLCFLSFLLLVPLTHAFTWQEIPIEQDDGTCVIIDVLDYDQDGDMDLFGWGDVLSVWYNDGMQNFSRTSLGLPIDVVYAYVDLDLDGDKDVISDPAVGWGVDWWENIDGSQYINHPINDEINPYEMDVVDWDNDGDMDILSAGDGSNYTWHIRIHENDGNHNFSLISTTTLSPHAHIQELKAVDFNEDGYQDIIAGFGRHGTSTSFIACLVNNGDDTFTVHELADPYDIDFMQVLDVDGDSDMDILTASRDDATYIYENNGDLTLTQHTLTTDQFTHINAYDLDGDGWMEIVLGQYNNYLDMRWYNANRDWTWTLDNEQFFHKTRNTIFADINQDGATDMLGVGWVLRWFRQLWLAEALELRAETDRQTGVVSLSWTTAQGPYRELIEYRVYRDGTLVASTSDTTATDQLPERGYFTYTIETVYTDGTATAERPDYAAWPAFDWSYFENMGTGIPAGWERGHSPWTDGYWMGVTEDQSSYFTSPHLLAYDRDVTHGWGEDDWVLLLTETYPVSGVESGSLHFTHVYIHDESTAGVRVRNRVGGTVSDWDTLAVYTDYTSGPVELNISDWLTGADEIQFSFGVIGTDNYNAPRWAIDDYYLTFDGNDEPVALTLSPQNTVIPQDGGTLVYDTAMDYQNSLPVPNTHFWTEAELPDGSTVGPLFNVAFTLQPFMNTTVTDLTQTVPSDAPAGDYVFTGYLGYPDNPSFQVSDSFGFVKEGVATDGLFVFDPEDWTAGGQFTLAGDSQNNASTRPDEFRMHAAYPNPFNAATSVRVELPEAAELAVTVYNVAGQQVATLAAGEVAAGTHTLSFNAADLASGLYFIRAQVPGKYEQVQKVMLVR